MSPIPRGLKLERCNIHRVEYFPVRLWSSRFRYVYKLRILTKLFKCFIKTWNTWWVDGAVIVPHKRLRNHAALSIPDELQDLFAVQNRIKWDHTCRVELSNGMEWTDRQVSRSVALNEGKRNHRTASRQVITLKNFKMSNPSPRIWGNNFHLKEKSLASITPKPRPVRTKPD